MMDLEILIFCMQNAPVTNVSSDISMWTWQLNTEKQKN
jgi:hypothetical protein